MIYSGGPLAGVSLCLNSEGGTIVGVGLLASDGSFRLMNANGRAGANPGRYQAYLSSPRGGPSVPAKYCNPRTSGLEIEIAAGANELNIDLN